MAGVEPIFFLLQGIAKHCEALRSNRFLSLNKMEIKQQQRSHLRTLAASRRVPDTHTHDGGESINWKVVCQQAPILFSFFRLVKEEKRAPKKRQRVAQFVSMVAPRQRRIDRGH